MEEKNAAAKRVTAEFLKSRGLKGRGKARKKPLSATLVSLLGNLIGVISILIAVMSITFGLYVMDYHHEQCVDGEPASQLVIGDTLIVTMCSMNHPAMEEALVESFSDEVPDA